MPITAGIAYSLHEGGKPGQPFFILVHGAGGSQLSWTPGLRRLPGTNVLAIDLPGHGRSPRPALQSIQAYTDCLEELRAALQLDQIVLVGHSMGGAISLTYALHYPQRVSRLCLISTGAYLGVAPDLLEQFSNMSSIPLGVTKFLQRAFSPSAKPILVQESTRMLLENRPSVIQADWRACAAFDLREAVTNILTPTWIIAGSEDQLTPLAYAHFLANRLANARLTVVPGGSHMLVLEKPQVVSQVLVSISNELVPPALRHS
ncbi:MAG TPA: alpha/beta hydrolase [Anaerolineaceae bacterium]